jgi:hypothetical protein
MWMPIQRQQLAQRSICGLYRSFYGGVGESTIKKKIICQAGPA